MISIKNDSILNINTSIPSLPKNFDPIGGTQLPNGDVLVSGDVKYLHYQSESNQWTNIGTLKSPFGMRKYYSSIFIDGRMFSTGGDVSSFLVSLPDEEYSTRDHEEFSIEGGVKERKEMPIPLNGHSATIFGEHKMLISGGENAQER